MNEPPLVTGLPTLALLKAEYDRGRDHVDMFQPFIDDVIASAPTDDLSIESIRDRILQDHGLKIPLATLSTLLTRATRRGVVRREGGRYIRATIPSDRNHLRRERARVQREHDTVARALIGFFNERGRQIDTEEEALHLLLTFLSANQTELLLDEYIADEARLSAGLTRRDTRLIARFIESVCLKDPHLSEYLDSLTQGLVLQNALLLRDIAAANRQFRDLEAFFDSGFLFGALGLKGASTRIAYVEALDILKATNVRLRVFDKTINEMKRILAVYEHHLATAQGRGTLYPTDLTRFFLTNQYSPSDIRGILALIAHDLAQLGIATTPLPNRDRRYTLDEEGLAKKLQAPRDQTVGQRIIHDVDCIAGVLVRRGDRNPQALEDAHAVFATSTVIVVRNVGEWYAENGGEGVSPAVHHLALSNLAWLKKPAAAQRLQLRELVALCEAALRPSRDTWNQFLAHLRRLEEDGRVTSDEAVAILASELTDRLLARLEDDDQVEPDSIAEIVERVKESYRQEADVRVAAAEGRAAMVAEQHRRMVIRLTARADKLAMIGSHALLIVAAVLIAYPLLISMPGLFPSTQVRGVARLTGVALFVVSLFSLLAGHHLQRWREWLEAKFRGWLRHVMLGANGDEDSATTGAV